MRVDINKDEPVALAVKVEILREVYTALESVAVALAVLELDRAGVVPVTEPKARAACLALLREYAKTIVKAQEAQG